MLDVTIIKETDNHTLRALEGATTFTSSQPLHNIYQVWMFHSKIQLGPAYINKIQQVHRSLAAEIKYIGQLHKQNNTHLVEH